ncbi:MAG: plastocyanin/azurin family copper-binding protein [Gaiellaceae bacterium]
MTRRALPLLLILTAFALGLAACGGGSDSASTTPAATGGGSTGGGGGGETLKIAADPSGALKYDPTALTASAGSVTIDFTNDSSLPHDVTVEGPGVEDVGTDVVTGASASVTVDLQAGEYTYYCSVDGHRAAGMEGKITVQ